MPVFISYSHDSQAHRERILGLSERLRSDGFESILDQYVNGSPKQGWPRWMLDQIDKATYVLVICTETYYRRFRGFEQPDIGKGVDWEGSIITQELYRAQSQSVKFVPVMFDSSCESFIPEPLRGATHYVLDSEARYGELCNFLAGIAGVQPRPVSPRQTTERRTAKPISFDHPVSGESDSPTSGPALTTAEPFRFALPSTAGTTSSRSPIVIALEDVQDPLKDDDLLQTERHITVTLPTDVLSELRQIGQRLAKPDEITLPEIWDLGRRAWRLVEGTQPRLTRLLELLARSDMTQPVAWTGKTQLLLDLHRTLLVAHTQDSEDFHPLLSVGFGAHYFNPIGSDRQEWHLHRRPTHHRAVKTFWTSSAVEPRRLVEAAASDVAVLAGESSSIRTLIETILGHPEELRIRVAIGFGEPFDSDQAVDEAMRRVACVSIGGCNLQDDDLAQALTDAFEDAGTSQASPSILSASRRAWLEWAHANGNTAAFLDGLFWANWSWIGRPLFGGDFGRALPAAVYPHLMHLRSVEADDWYFNRHKGIPRCYEADQMARATKPEEQFHLYLSGAGGTGKSVFLHYLYRLFKNQPETLAVWYRVDAPSSEWMDVQKRLIEELHAAATEKLGSKSADLIPASYDDLRDLLPEAARRLGEAKENKVKRIILFIDQLERTFESGDEPDYERLERISEQILDLLGRVEVGKGVRIFIASRKQYLPDFLRSFRAAANSGLEFNVLQAISDQTEQTGFANNVLRWCQEQNLLAKSVTFDTRASRMLADRVNGHPLNMMLGLIHIFSHAPSGEITQSAIEKSRPWEKLFHVDLQLASKDDIDWFFLLAMAHARTEIVRFEEVWWRLRLIEPKLTRRVEDLEPTGVLERLWLLGILGRTIYPRPYQGDPARFLEFFHANLRDFLLQAMGQGVRDLDLPRRCETPQAWRALDRLSVAAHEWEQGQQLLAQEDVASLMAQAEVTVERIKREGESEREPFYLLFLRDAERARGGLWEAAQECLAYSALVHEHQGRWAMDRLFPDIQDRIACCHFWLQRCSQENRGPILRYLIEMNLPDTIGFLCSIVLSDAHVADGLGIPADLWIDLATILDRPLFAARYRTDVVAAVLESAVEETRTSEVDLEILPGRVREFIANACNADPYEITQVISQCISRFKGSQNPKLRRFSDTIVSTEQATWLEGVVATADRYAATEAREPLSRTRAAVEIVVGEDLFQAIDDNRLSTWQNRVLILLGIPLPGFELRQGELGVNELELRIHGRSVAIGEFHPGFLQLLQRHWQGSQSSFPEESRITQNDALQEVVLWVTPTLLREISWELPSQDFDEAIISWLTTQLRWNVNRYFGYDLLSRFLGGVETLSDSSRLFRGVSQPVLRQVIANLAQESVPLSTHRDEIVDQLQLLLTEVKDVEILTQKLREHVKDALCRIFCDPSGELTVLTIDQGLEERLASQIVSRDAERVLRIDPNQALTFAAAVRGHLELNLHRDLHPVLLCIPTLRQPLWRLLRGFDPRIVVLSYSELPSTFADITVTSVGEVSDTTPAHSASEGAHG